MTTCHPPAKNINRFLDLWAQQYHADTCLEGDPHKDVGESKDVISGGLGGLKPPNNCDDTTIF